MFRRALKIAAIILAVSTVSVQAITKEAMEKARVEAAAVYVRCVNNGADYLDNMQFSSMAELEKAVASHSTDKENLDKFKNATNATDYASWDKDKTLKYFTEDLFNAVGRPQNDQYVIGRVKSQFNKINFEEVSEESNEPTDAVTLSENNEYVEDVSTSVPNVSLAQDTVEEVNTESTPRTVPTKKKGSNWFLIVLLVLIVGIAAWLIYYASKVVKGGGARKRRGSDDDATDYVDNSKLDVLERENDKLRQENRALKGECKTLQSELERVRAEVERLESDRAVAARREKDDKETTEIEPAAHRRPAAQPRSERVIWLGRVNADGIFVRADKEYNPDATLYRMVTTDGYSGSFTFADEPESVEMAVGNPRRMLGGGCICANMEDTEGVSHINTLNSGTAIFESGCWKVIRKAKISYS